LGFTKIWKNQLKKQKRDYQFYKNNRLNFGYQRYQSKGGV